MILRTLLSHLVQETLSCVICLCLVTGPRSVESTAEGVVSSEWRGADGQLGERTERNNPPTRRRVVAERVRRGAARLREREQSANRVLESSPVVAVEQVRFSLEQLSATLVALVNQRASTDTWHASI